MNYKNKIVINQTIEKKFNAISILVIFIFSIIFIKLINIQIINKEMYVKNLEKLTMNIIEGSSAPRGRIYDRNHNLLVDNVGEKVIYYKKEKHITKSDEIDMAYLLSKTLDVNFSNISIYDLKNFWIVNNIEESNNRITEEEKELLKKRKLTNYDIEKLKIDRITEEELNKFNDLDKEAAYIYSLMNKGYSYEEKIIKNNNISDYEYAYVAENLNKFKGVGVKLDWKRKYLYGNTLRGILGTISSSSQGLPYELKDYYLNKGYKLNDRVGLTYLEYQYDDLLRGKKTKYKYENGRLVVHEEGMRGHDIVLSIDINLQLEIERIIEEELRIAKTEPNTQYLNRNFVIVSDPKTGEIIAMAAKQIVNTNGEYKIYDYSPYITTTPVTVGSVVKGASMTVGYKTKAIDIGTRVLDECIKIKSTPIKCSWNTNLGVLNDIDALRLSSNSYQFKIAMKVGGAHYVYNMPLAINKEAFNIYRNTFAEFGLGVKTEIDLPIESVGYKGTNQSSGLLLNFAVGQYDNYTSIQLSQYINTIANDGVRMKFNLLKEVHKPTNNDLISELLHNIEPKELNKVDVDKKYIDRIKEGFKAVMGSSGLGYGYMDIKHKPAGKTGTSESFYDSDGDGVIDKETITTTFAGYAPYDDPKMSIVVVSPDSGHKYGSNFISQVNRRIGKKVTNKYFEIYK